MTAPWPKVRLGEVLQPINREESVDSEKEYRILGAHWYAKGLYTKDVLNGSEIRASKIYRVEEGDFVYNRLFAWKGSFAVATAENDECYVSNEFPCFNVVKEKLSPDFLKWYFSREPSWNESLGLSVGATPTSRNRLKEDKLLGMEIPLPPLPEQRRIVARIEAMASQIASAKAFRISAMKEIEDLLVCMAHRLDLDDEAKKKSGWNKMQLNRCIVFVDDSHHVLVDGSYSNLGIYSFGKGLFHKQPIEGAATSAKTLRRVKEGQFIYSRLFAFEGSYGMVSKEYDGCYVSGEYPTFECIPSLIQAEFLEAYFKAPSIWREVAIGSKGLGDRRQRVQPAQILSHTLWVPPIKLQNGIAAIKEEAEQMKRLQAESAAEIGALLPAILDRAFQGEL